MHSFHYRKGRLHAEDVDLDRLAAEHGTPLYVYSARTIVDHYRRLDAALAQAGIADREICYAVKANSNLALLALLAQQGAGFDIVSGGELFRVRRAGGEAGRCTFAGVGKTRPEIEEALRAGIYCFNVESEAELELIGLVAAKLSLVAPVALRVNPDVAAGGHRYITTGHRENKFGVDLARARQLSAWVARHEHLRLRGIQMHIGSQITEAGPFTRAVEVVAPLAEELRREFGAEFFSVGGGLGIVYQGSLESGDGAWWHQERVSALTIEEYVRAIAPVVRPLGMRILLEPGRFLVGNAGVLLTRVLFRKQTAAGKRFLIVDAGMNDLIRPALYQGYHEIVPVRSAAAAQAGALAAAPTPTEAETVDVVGPVCESGDFLAQDRPLPRAVGGDLLAVMSAGAYGAAMASNYNSRPLPAEVLVAGDAARLIRARQDYEDLVRLETIPVAAPAPAPAPVAAATAVAVAGPAQG